MERHIVILSSELYGDDRFTYDSFEKAMAGLERLSKSAREHYEKDGIERRVSYVVEDDDEEEEEELGEWKRGFFSAIAEANSTPGAHPAPLEAGGDDSAASPKTESHSPAS